ncbi:27328_t:CDS:2, partial [Gigaspora margarita]
MENDDNAIVEYSFYVDSNEEFQMYLAKNNIESSSNTTIQHLKNLIIT